ncbi:TetR/AcrR family transcriptional regulator [Mycolicibacterium sp. 120266]|uniref:TetR/AcrR family transcriptional regulator n=1 Tax=Mycolicibacterium sp. 120266 TaxID=3090601 RepID=UPI00299E4644|nr:TetR/AcrR family transcriptional regulator [Mycolicibacterium sp. 120266]MDX1873895.1 TetR/AcrR family transcriptional regulator [Mycolicibacterium sp. 120266]
MSQAMTTDTREAILLAAFRCFRTQSLRKTTMVDIARAAEVSRSTVYEYFRDKDAVVQACAELASQLFYRNMAKAVDRTGGSSLEDRLTAMAVFVTQARRMIEPEIYFDDETVNVMMTKNAAHLLKECADFLAPYFAAARVTGEVRQDLDLRSATEWFARMLFSLFTTPSPHFEIADEPAVAAFARAYAVRGFVDDLGRRR